MIARRLRAQPPRLGRGGRDGRRLRGRPRPRAAAPAERPARADRPRRPGHGAGRAGQGRRSAPTRRTQSLAPSGADGPTIDAIKARPDRRLIVGVDQNSYRWGYRDPNNPRAGSDLEGFDIDLVHAIAKDILGDPDAVQFRAIPTDQRIPALQQRHASTWWCGP